MRTLVFEIFDPIGSLIYASSSSDSPPLSAERKSVCLLSHLVPEILGPKVGLIFHHNALLKSFKHFVSIFSLIFNPIDLLFH